MPAAADPRYPIGRFEWKGPNTPEQRKQLIARIAALPSEFRAAVRGLTSQQLETPYREGGWTLRQVVHHVPESHMNAYIRCKLALTEDEPTIKPYAEERWALLADVPVAPVEASLSLLDSLHQRWAILLGTLKESDFERVFVHPESGPTSIDKALAHYVWHGMHHTAHITSVRKAKGWG